ncbi:unnamed protein product [Protopolystoma xenopodis]|uniref:Uncharacterized protein n=1 Tax=Protopolystoma xenopodis TaxID=117903 RepID=A0A3S5B5A3_9PLAT|nr:unnamed protein product [Protopolystoma xenopodis]
MAKLADDADYDAGETSANVPSLLSDAGNHDNYYDRRLWTSLIQKWKWVEAEKRPVEEDTATRRAAEVLYRLAVARRAVDVVSCGQFSWRFWS